MTTFEEWLPLPVTGYATNPKVTHGWCSQCGESIPIGELIKDTEGDYESGYYTIDLCPKCEDGGCIEDYSYEGPSIEITWPGDDIPSFYYPNA